MASREDLKKEWIHWAGEAYNAFYRLQEIQEELERWQEEYEGSFQTTGTADLTDLENAIELNVGGALGIAEEAEDIGQNFPEYPRDL